MKKLRILAKYMFIAVFCGVIGLSFLVYNLFSTRFSTDKHENRLRTQLPQTLQSDPRQLPQTLNLFMEDNAPFRFQLTWVNAQLDYALFGTSQSKKVLPGKDGWFFYKENEPEARPLARYQGGTDTLDSLATLAQSSAKLQVIHDRLAEAGCTLVLDMTPDKARIYREYLPAGYPIVSEQNRTDRMVAYMRSHTTLPVNWQYSLLRSQARLHPERLLYYKADGHWNALGALLGLDGVLEELNLPTRLPTEYTVKPVGTMTGDMAYATSLYDSVPDETCWEVENYAALFSADSRSVRVFGDSFGEEYLPYLQCRFAAARWERLENFDASLLDDPDCQILILECNERNLDKLLDIVENF